MSFVDAGEPIVVLGHLSTGLRNQMRDRAGILCEELI